MSSEALQTSVMERKPETILQPVFALVCSFIDNILNSGHAKMYIFLLKQQGFTGINQFLEYGQDFVLGMYKFGCLIQSILERKMSDNTNDRTFIREIDLALYDIISAYIQGGAEHRFEKRKDNKTPYFVHCYEVAEIVATDFDMSNIKECDDIDLLNSSRAFVYEMIVSLLHDVVENVDLSLSIIKEKYGNLVSSVIDKISKKKLSLYYDRLKENNRFESVVSYLDSLDEACRNELLNDKKSEFSGPNDLYQSFKECIKHLKDIRGEDYFGSLSTYYLDSVNLSEDDLIAMSVFYKVKFADRKHSLKTLGNLKSEDRTRKIKETREYFLFEIQKEGTHPYIIEIIEKGQTIIMEELEKLKEINLN